MEDELERARRDRAERDRLEEAEDIRAARPFRVRSALEGCADFTLARVYGDFIDLLRSGDPLDQHLRNSIADALERGQTDKKGCVRLCIEGDASFFKAIANAESEGRLLDAGLYIARERKKNRLAAAVRNDLPARFGIVDATDYERRAKRSYKLFQQWLEDNYDKVHGWPQRNDVHFYEDTDTREAENYFGISRSAFLAKGLPAHPLESEWSTAGGDS